MAFGKRRVSAVTILVAIVMLLVNLFAGDDLGDLAAFDAVDASGLPGVTVGSASVEVTALTDRADVVVDGPAGVVSLLDHLATSISG